jgi:alpha-tubulin suppressor-like RCC1 family protein
MFNFNPELLDINNVRLMGCGRKHYIIVTKDNNLLTWGNVFKEKSNDPSQQTEGFTITYGDSMFDGGQIDQLEVKYSIFGALVKD